MGGGGVEVTVAGPHIEGGEFWNSGQRIGQGAGARLEQSVVEFGAEREAAGAFETLKVVGAPGTEVREGSELLQEGAAALLIVGHTGQTGEQPMRIGERGACAGVTGAGQEIEQRGEETVREGPRREGGRV
jgi:hypothetical protein